MKLNKIDVVWTSAKLKTMLMENLEAGETRCITEDVQTANRASMSAQLTLLRFILKASLVDTPSSWRYARDFLSRDPKCVLIPSSYPPYQELHTHFYLSTCCSYDNNYAPALNDILEKRCFAVLIVMLICFFLILCVNLDCRSTGLLHWRYLSSTKKSAVFCWRNTQVKMLYLERSHSLFSFCFGNRLSQESLLVT